jgi:hypothetical protein
MSTENYAFLKFTKKKYFPGNIPAENNQIRIFVSFLVLCC